MVIGGEEGFRTVHSMENGDRSKRGGAGSTVMLASGMLVATPGGGVSRREMGSME